MKLEAEVQQSSYRNGRHSWGKCGESFKRLCTHTISHEQQIQLHNKNSQDPDGNKNKKCTETAKRLKRKEF